MQIISTKFEVDDFNTDMIKELQALCSKLFFSYLYNISKVIRLQAISSTKFKYQIENLVFTLDLTRNDGGKDYYILKYLIYILHNKSHVGFKFSNLQKDIEKIKSINRGLSIYLGEYAPIKVESLLDFNFEFNFHILTESTLSFNDRLKCFDDYINNYAKIELTERQQGFLDRCMFTAKANKTFESNYFIEFSKFLPYNIYLVNLTEEKFKSYLKVYIVNHLSSLETIEGFEREAVLDIDDVDISFTLHIKNVFPLIFTEFRYSSLSDENSLDFKLDKNEIILNYMVDVIYNNAAVYFEYLKTLFSADYEHIHHDLEIVRAVQHNMYMLFQDYDFNNKDVRCGKTIYNLFSKLKFVYYKEDILRIIKTFHFDFFIIRENGGPFITNRNK